MDTSLPHHAPIPPQPPHPPHPAAAATLAAAPAARQQDRITRITALTPQDATAGLLWLAINDPATCDAILDKLDNDAIDDPDPAREPEPYCAQCDADIGIFTRDGLHWQHYTGQATNKDSIKRFDPGHPPVVAWRPPRVPAIR